MFANKNNLRSELTANIWVLDTSISITSGEWILWENDMVACLEHYENDVCTKREIIKITAKNNDTFTVTRWFAVCIMNDATKQQWQGSQTFAVGDFLSLYLSKELRESITQNIWINETALQTMIWHITAPRTCINNSCLSWKQSIDSAYNTKYWWIAGFGDASDGDCVITTNDLDDHWYFYFDASCEYNFNNLTICDGVVVRFLWIWVPKINVRNNFINCGEIELKSWFVSNTNLTDCRLEQWCQICNNCTDWWLCQGWRWWCGWNDWSPWCSGCPWIWDIGWNGWMWWQGCPWCPAVWCNGWTWWCWRSTNNCNGGWWWGGGWWAGLYWNGGNGWNGWYNGSSQTYGWEWWKGWNSGLFGRAWNGGEKWNAYSWNGWKGGDWWDWRIGGDWQGANNRSWDAPWIWWKGVLCGWNGGWMDWSYSWWAGGDAITNVYWFHLNARNIWNKCVNARWWNGWNGGCVECWTSWNGWNGANGWQMIISYDSINEQWCFDVRGGCGWCPWNVRRPSCWWTSWSYGNPWNDGWVVFHSVNYPYISNFNLENDDVNESILISWKDPMMKQSAPNPRKSTMIRVSTTNFPASITDWTLVVNETTKNQYETTPFSMSATDGVTYYFTAFAIAQDDTMIDVQTNSITTDFAFAWYKRVEYIQSSWTQYFVVWSSFKTSYKSVIDMEMVTTWWDYIPLWLLINDGSKRYWINAYGSYFKVIAWWSSWRNTKSEDKNRHTFTLNKSTATVDWTNYSMSYVNYTFNWWIGVFGYHNVTIDDAGYKASAKIYKLDIYDENWNHIFDLYPVYRKSDNVIWMLDIVNKVFYTNQWSWSFTKWPDIN